MSKTVSQPRNPYQGDRQPWWLGGDMSWGDVNLCRQLAGRSHYTPDFHELKWKKRIPVFVYGEQMTDGGHNYMLQGAEYYGRGRTMTDFFTMKSGGFMPVAFEDKGKTSQNFGYIRGEVWGVTVEHIHLLDNYEKNTIEYNRTVKPIFLEDQKEYNRMNGNRSYLKCWMYLGDPRFWEGQVLADHPITTYRAGVSSHLIDRKIFEWKGV